MGADNPSLRPDDDAARRWLEAAPVAPDWTAPTSLREWTRKRTALRSNLWKLLGDLPPRPRTANVVTVSREEREGYIVEKFTFDNGAGATVPGYLFLPRNSVKSKVPGIVYCHWHGGEYDIGKEELFKTDHTPEAPGPTLARRGYAVVGIDAYCFGERNGQGPGGPEDKGSSGEMTASKFQLWVGRSLWGMIVRDDQIALDYLLSRPEVDPERIGATGISMGSTRSWWLMALDERVRAGVGVACLTRYRDLAEEHGLKYHGIYYYVPGLLRSCDTEAIVALIAPRPILFLTGDQDLGSPVQGIRTIEKKVRPVYDLYRSSASFRSVIYPNVGHSYTPEMWREMLAWMETHLQRATPTDLNSNQ
jgi:dipeptidyl aminopeptidase/acylaminoacyl peptidase